MAGLTTVGCVLGAGAEGAVAASGPGVGAVVAEGAGAGDALGAVVTEGAGAGGVLGVTDSAGVGAGAGAGVLTEGADPLVACA